jgi:hypothetical protein
MSYANVAAVLDAVPDSAEAFDDAVLPPDSP